jgi:hypothetical protein
VRNHLNLSFLGHHRSLYCQVKFCFNLCCREDEHRWQDEMLRQIDDWTEKNSSLLRTEAWGGAGPVPCIDASAGFHQKMEHVWELFNHAGRCIVKLQESLFSHAAIQTFERLHIHPFVFVWPSLITSLLCFVSWPSVMIFAAAERQRAPHVGPSPKGVAGGSRAAQGAR